SHPGTRRRPARYSEPYGLDVQEPYIWRLPPGMISGLGQSAELCLYIWPLGITDRHQYTAERISAEICVYLRFPWPQLCSRLALRNGRSKPSVSIVARHLDWPHTSADFTFELTRSKPR